ncbi:ankyrin repeat domain-containing protein [Ectobacillus ponti]|uniref:Ankyrin repeat domain-containing protein n=1 Tax=Ectobacillus ponti TaxID=2961894 RepID=A0AA41X8T9_9BACI|nr:ankyrin repeat domain-containing protein [Ectobacillus ponti]MCP8968490.1 ankyrin repeat domain-containing protein [Ectobacillus ponti]
MRLAIVGICMLLCLSGCSTEAARKQQAQDLYKAIYAGDAKKAASIAGKEDVAELPVLEKTPPQLLAAKVGQTAIVKNLVSNGADAKAADAEGTTILHAAAANGDTALADYMLQKKANVNVKTKEGWTPLMRAMTPTSSVPDRTKAVEWLLQHGADANMATKTGWTPLHEAVYQNQTGAVKLLLPKSKRIDSRDADGTTPLMIAVRGGNLELVQLLIQAGSDVNVQDRRGCTALYYAVSYELKPIVADLLAHGAKQDISAKDGETPADLAKARGNAALLQLLQTK